MVCDNINNFETYSLLGDKINKALTYLMELKEEDLVLGKNEIDDDMYINYMNYQTDIDTKKIWESHIDYLDIHYILEGEEKIMLSDVSSMKITKEYDKSIDAAFYDGSQQTEIKFKKGMFLICFPQDVHKVGVSLKDSCNVKKVVCKVKI